MPEGEDWERLTFVPGAYAYQARLIHLARERGYDDKAHIEALVSGDEDQISLTHPYNWLTEEEVEEASA